MDEFDYCEHCHRHFSLEHLDGCPFAYAEPEYCEACHRAGTSQEGCLLHAQEFNCEACGAEWNEYHAPDCPFDPHWEPTISQYEVDSRAKLDTVQWDEIPF